MVGFLVIVLLQIFFWFWQWNNFGNRLIFDKVKGLRRTKIVPIFGPPCIYTGGCYQLLTIMLLSWLTAVCVLLLAAIFNKRLRVSWKRAFTKLHKRRISITERATCPLMMQFRPFSFCPFFSDDLGGPNDRTIYTGRSYYSVLLARKPPAQSLSHCCYTYL